MSSSVVIDADVVEGLKFVSMVVTLPPPIIKLASPHVPDESTRKDDSNCHQPLSCLPKSSAA